MWLLLAFGCDGAPPPRGPAAPCAEERTPVPGGVRDRIPDVRLEGSWTLEVARSFWMGNLDDDRCAEILIGEVRANGRPYSTRPRERISLIEGTPSSGFLGDQASMTIRSGEGLDEDLADFGAQIAAVPSTGEILVSAVSMGDDADVLSFPIGTQDGTSAGATGVLVGTWNLWAIAHYMTAGPTLGGRPVLVASNLYGSDTDSTAGGAFLFDLPLVGTKDETTADAVYRGNEGDGAMCQIADVDFDADGWTDLVITTGGVGKAALLSAPPTGEHLVWDVANATIEASFAPSTGDFTEAGDLDGDGSPELLIGAPYEGPGGVLYVLQGPFEGSRAIETAEWTIHGEVGLDLTGISMVIAHLDGDDHPDLAVSQPGNGFAGDEGGRVLLFAGPLAQGAYPSPAADVVLISNGTGAGEFGSGLEAGDLDGDGSDDLAVTGWLDEDADGHPVGALQILYGSLDLFP